MIDVTPINALTDNYIWCVVNRANRHCVIVDPGEATPVLSMLRANQLILSAILITHHHWDHTSGISEILAQYDVPVYGPAHEPVLGMTHHLNGGDTLALDDVNLKFHVMDIPGHTLGHIAYYTPGIAFTGDTLFTGGCGKIFEGTIDQMFASLMSLKALDDDTLIYCGHEYTASNLKFAQIVEPDNIDIQQRIEQVTRLRESQMPSVPAALATEKLTNPFLRCDHEAVIRAAERYSGHKLMSPADVLGVIREWKNIESINIS